MIGFIATLGSDEGDRPFLVHRYKPQTLGHVDYRLGDAMIFLS
jgi:hypothetical protein